MASSIPNRPFVPCILACCVTSFLAGRAPLSACTIVSGVAPDGQVWNANNEDGPDGSGNFINVFPIAEEDKYGYFTLSYESPANGNGPGIQGGMNEAGLTFDFNAIREVPNVGQKKPFPGGNAAILPHILATMDSVEQVVKFFETYWFQDGFNTSQMHVADRNGQFAIIGPSGIVMSEKNGPLVSTNFDLAANEDGSWCWRYPIAQQILKERNIGLPTMIDICRQTVQKDGSLTLYSNVQNLTTGDVWFFSRQYDQPVKTNIRDLLAKGQRSYSFDDLKELVESREPPKRTKPERVELSQTDINRVAGTYRHPFGFPLNVESRADGIEVSAEGMPAMTLFPQSEDRFFLPEANFSLVFRATDGGSGMQMSLYEDGYRAFTATRIE